jgi:hypothetical protein
MARACYGVMHLRCPELYEDGWLKQGTSLEALRTRLANDLDRHLFRP